MQIENLNFDLYRMLLKIIFIDENKFDSNSNHNMAKYCYSMFTSSTITTYLWSRPVSKFNATNPKSIINRFITDPTTICANWSVN